MQSWGCISFPKVTWTPVLISETRYWTRYPYLSLSRLPTGYLRTNAEAEALILWPPDVKSQLTGKDPTGGEGDDRRQDGWMASLTQWSWFWASSRRWWRTGDPGMLQSMDMTEQLNNKRRKSQKIKKVQRQYTYWLLPSNVHQLAR